MAKGKLKKSAKTKKKKPTKSPVSPPVQLSQEQYQQRMLILVAAYEAFQTDQHVYYDLGSGERPQKVQAEFEHIARREKIPVYITPVKGKPTLAFVFPPRKKSPPQVVVRDAEGTVKFRSPEQEPQAAM